MSELLLHFVIPFAAFSYFRKPKEAFLVSLFALLPDLDVLMHVHRSWTHSIILILAFCGVMLLIFKVFNSKLFGFGFLATLALISHLLLDLFTTYTPILWPLVSQSFFVNLTGGVKISGNIQVYVNSEVFIEPTSFAHFESFDAPIFTSEGLIIAVMLVAPVLFSKYSGMLRKLLRKVRES